MDILFRTFLDILLLYPPWFYTASHFLRFPFLLSLTLTFLSKILRGHTVPHFLRSCFASTLSSLSPLFSIFTIYSSHHSYLRFCVDILFRTFLDILFLPSPLLSILSKILRGHTVPHFLRSLLRSLLISSHLFLRIFYQFETSLGTLFVNLLFLFYLSKILRGHTAPHFLRFLFFPSSY